LILFISKIFNKLSPTFPPERRLSTYVSSSAKKPQARSGGMDLIEAAGAVGEGESRLNETPKNGVQRLQDAV
jgi:hypothetical protein